MAITAHAHRSPFTVHRSPLVGAEDGTALRVAGRGMASRDPGGVPGDLYRGGAGAAGDPRYRRDRADLWRQEPLPLTDAVLGTTLEVPTSAGWRS